MNGTSKYMGWVQLGAGIAAIFLEVWNQVHTGGGNLSVGAAGIGLAAGGAGHIAKAK